MTTGRSLAGRTCYGHHPFTAAPTADAKTDRATLAHLRRTSRTDERQHADHQAEVTRLLDQIDRQREEIERARLEAERAREDAEHERGHTHTLFNQVKDLADRLAHAEAERARAVTELAQARQSWWRRLIDR